MGQCTECSFAPSGLQYIGGAGPGVCSGGYELSPLRGWNGGGAGEAEGGSVGRYCGRVGDLHAYAAQKHATRFLRG